MRASPKAFPSDNDGLNGAKLQRFAENCLRDRGQLVELELLRQCQLEVRVIAGAGESNWLAYVTVRTSDELAKMLRAAEDEGTAPFARAKIYLAVRDSLPVGYQLAGFDARAGLPSEGKAVASGAAAGSIPGGPGSKAASEAPRLVLGRMSYRADFMAVWIEGKEYDLQSRPSARWCLKLMVVKEAVDEEAALDFATEIQPYVRERCGARADEPRLHNYFAGRLTQLRTKLVRAVGRSGKFYLLI